MTKEGKRKRREGGEEETLNSANSTNTGSVDIPPLQPQLLQASC